MWQMATGLDNADFKEWITVCICNSLNVHKAGDKPNNLNQFKLNFFSFWFTNEEQHKWYADRLELENRTNKKKGFVVAVEEV